MGYLYGILSMVALVLWIYYLLMMIRGRGGSCNSVLSRKCGSWTMPGAEKKGGNDADPLDGVRDPKEAAVLLMIGMAECEGIISSAQKQKILDFGMHHFGLSQVAMGELYAATSFLLKGAPNLEKVVQKMSALLNASCSDQEKQQVIEAMADIARADGGSPNADQQNMLAKTASTLKVAAV